MNKKVKSLPIVALLFAVLSSIYATSSGEAAVGYEAPLDKMQTADLNCGKACMQAQKWTSAANDLEKVVKAVPDSCQAHFLLGQIYCKLKNLEKGKKHLRTAIRVGQGSINAQKANQALMLLPVTAIKPKTGADTRLIAMSLGIGRERGLSASKATVIDFYANWCQPCKQLDLTIQKLKSDQKYANTVNFLKVDVDDPNSQALVDQYEISPIPTVVFINDEGEVVSFCVGYSGESKIVAGIAQAMQNK